MVWTEPYFLMLAGCGLLFVVVGWVLLRFPPRKVNPFYGYRTPASMRSQERWDFAQPFAARMLIRLGVVALVLSLVGLFVAMPPVAGTLVAGGIVVAMVVAVIVQTERAMRQRFGR